MKDINFIKTLSVKEQHGLRKWAMFSFGTLALIIVSIAGLQIMQLSMFISTKKEHTQLTYTINTLNTQLAQNQNLKSQMCCLGDQCKTIDSLTCATQKPYACITGITGACGKNITVQSCDLKNKKLILSGQCANVQQTTHFLQQLQKNNQFSQVQLTSLQPAPGNFVTFTLKGTIA